MKTNTFNAFVICLFCGLLLCQFTACSTFYPDTAIPEYISVDSVVFSCNYQTYGSSSAKVSDVWVDANYNQIGVYDVPSLFPLLAQGSTPLELEPGIIENGIANSRSIYPFYTYDSLVLNLQPKNTYSIIPHLTYRSDTKVVLNADFEGGNSFRNVVGSDTSMIRLTNSPEIFEGNGCGYIALYGKDSVYQGVTVQSFVFPTTSPVYLELNYMCNIPFNISLTGISEGDTVPNYFLGVNTSGTWNKMYVNLTPYVQLANATSYQIGIFADLPPGVTQGQVYLDNIKLVHF